MIKGIIDITSQECFPISRKGAIGSITTVNKSDIVHIKPIHCNVIYKIFDFGDVCKTVSFFSLVLDFKIRYIDAKRSDICDIMQSGNDIAVSR